MFSGAIMATPSCFRRLYLGTPRAVLVGLVAGSLLAGSLAGIGRLLAASLGGTLVAVLLHLPVLIELLGGRPVASLVGPGTWPVGDLGVGGLFGLDTGGFRSDGFGWLVFVVPAMALAAASGRHLALGVRCLLYTSPSPRD